MTVFRAATLRTFFFAFQAGAKELRIDKKNPKGKVSVLFSFLAIRNKILLSYLYF